MIEFTMIICMLGEGFWFVFTDWLMVKNVFTTVILDLCEPRIYMHIICMCIYVSDPGMR